MSKPTDDLDAVRQVTALLEGFSDEDRERIIRWTREKLGMQAAAALPTPSASSPSPAALDLPAAGATATNIKTFMAQKDPKSERQLAAAVAYYYRFVAPEAQRKESVGADDLIEACRQADRDRPRNPAQTLVNAFHDGYLDRTGDRGQYKINSVGENLVAMVLPGGPATSRASRQATKKSGGPRRPSGAPRKRR